LGFNGEPDTADPESRTFRLANNNRAPAHSDTESEFIPNGVNRSRGEPFFATSYKSDLMDNYEMGYRTMFAEGSGRLNVTAFNMVWTDYQLSLTDPSSRPCDEVLPDPDPPDDVPNLCGQPWQAIVTNAGEAHITGLNAELDYAINDSWVFGANVMLLEAETDTTADLTGDGENDLLAGLRLPLTPELKASAWLDVTNPSEWFGGEEVFARLQISYTGDSVNKLDPIDPNDLDDANPQLTSKAYTIADFRTGIRGPDWELSFFVNNLMDERASYSIGTGQMLWGASSVQDGRAHFQKSYVNRPREFGVRYMKRWGD